MGVWTWVMSVKKARGDAFRTATKLVHFQISHVLVCQEFYPFSLSKVKSYSLNSKLPLWFLKRNKSSFQNNFWLFLGGGGCSSPQHPAPGSSLGLWAQKENREIVCQLSLAFLRCSYSLIMAWLPDMALVDSACWKRALLSFYPVFVFVFFKCL